MMSVNLRSLGISSLALRFAIAAAIALRLGAAHAEDTTSVTIDNFTFAPPEMTVKVGTTVTWTNHDDIPHTIVSAGTFRSRTCHNGNHFSFTCTAASGL